MSAAAASQSSSSTWSRSRLPVPVIGGSKSKQTVSATSIPVEARQRVASNSSADSMTLTGSSSTANRSKRQRSALPRPTTWFTSPSKSQTTVHSSSQPCRSMESDGDDDFVMVSVSPKAPPPESRNAPYIFGSTRPHPTTSETSTGPAVACGMTMAAQRLSLMETEDADDALTIDDSPIRFPAGQSRSLGPTGRGGAIMGRRRSTEERDSPEAARRFTSASVVSGGSIRQNEAVSDLTRSWMKRSRADVSPLGNQAFRRGSSPPPPDTPIHQNAAHTATSSFLGRPPPPQPLFPTLRPSHSFSRGGDDQQSVFLSPFPKKTSSSSSSSTSAAKSRTIAHIDNKENNIFSAKKSVSFEGLGTSRRTEEDTSTFGLGACRRGVLGSSNHNGNLEQGASASLFTASNVSPFISAAATRAQHNFHRRANSNDHNRLGRYSHGGGSVISRSHGHKSGLAQSALSGSSMPKSISNDSHSSILSQATSSSTILTIPDTHVFDDVKPLQAAFEVSEGPVTRKFKPRDSGVGLGDQVAMPAVKPVVTVPINMGEEENIVGLGLMGLQPRPNGRSSVLGIKPARPQLLKRASSCGDERQSPVETPGIIPVDGSAWPTAFGVDFAAATAIGTTGFEKDAKPSMPDTPVKRSAFSLGGATTGQPVRTLARVGHSVSQPVLPTAATMSVMRPSTKAFDLKRMSPPPKPTFSLLCSSNNASTDMESESSSSPLPPTLCKILTGPSLTVTTTESPESPVVSMMETDELSPTVRLSNVRGASLASTRAADQNVRMGLLRRLSSGVASSSETEEGDDTPTKRNEREVGMLVPGSGHSSLTTPTPSPRLSTDKLPSPLAIPSNKDVISVTNADGSHLLAPRLSLPAFSSTKHGKRLNHRQSAPEHATVQDEDMFEKRFVIVEALGKGAFSQVFKVKERDGEGVFAVKKARGVFDGVKDRLRHLEEVDILRHLSSRPHPHVITFIDAWEQNRQLYIQTELCLGSLAFFLEEYGKLVERLDEGRTWKIARELADGIEYIHSMGVIHFDLKPANILITTCGALKIGDFGLASRWPRVNAASILAGSGLGGDVGSTSTSTNKIADREGDRVYMPPEMLRGHYSMAADIFSYGLMILEVATNIFVPDGGAPWHALRQNDFTVVDFSPLSPALTDLITTCMRADPAERPPISNITQHPVIARARATGKDALAPESEMFLVKVLTGDMILPTSASEPSPQDADVDMSDA